MRAKFLYASFILQLLCTAFCNSLLAQEQEIPCPETMENVTAKDLAKCITGLKQSIIEIKRSRSSLQVEAYGQIGADGTALKSGGPMRIVAVRKDPATYEVKYVNSLSYAPTVVVGSTRYEDFVGAYVVNSNELGFTVEGKGTTLNPKPTGFWFIVIR